MKPLFHTSLVNESFDDPVLYVEFMFQKRALLFDLGNIHRLSPRKIFKISHAFVTHTHMDHFIGFDHLVRFLLGRDQTLSLYGPPGIIESVRGRLAGYNWNLVENYRYPFWLRIFEINEDHLLEIKLVCRKKFAPENSPKKIAISEAIIHNENQLTVKAIALDHKIPSIAYLLEEQFHLNVNKEKLKKMGLSTGPWLNVLKESVYSNKPDNYTIKVPMENNIKKFKLGLLKNEILTVTPGQKIGYVVDCDFTSENRKKIVHLMNGIDVLYIEAYFIEEDKERARSTAHLTAREAGELAREAEVKKMQVIHFSSKYSGNPGFLLEEAEEAFRG